MKTFTKEEFLWLVRVRPLRLIGKEIIYKDRSAKIIDITVSGDYLFLEYISTRKVWEPVGGVGESVTVDEVEFPADAGKPFTVASLTSSLGTLEKLVGQPGSASVKSLFEIVEALNKDMLGLKLKFEEKGPLGFVAEAMIEDYARQAGVTRCEALKLLLAHSKPHRIKRKHPKALAPEKIEAMRQMRKEKSGNEVAAFFHVSVSTVSRYCSNKKKKEEKS